jgi:tetratricopeptide (TPR) repeat protein
MTVRSVIIALSMLVLGAAAPSFAQEEDALVQEIRQLQDGWAAANYQTPEKQQDMAFKRLVAQADETVARYADRAEPLVWKAIILSSHAGAVGGLGALGKVKEARRLLEQAEAIDPAALDGSVYTSLGSLYYQVPGWPVGFGDDKQAEKYLKKALAVNPDGIDPNYFYGDYLLEQKRYQEAAVYLEKALQAPDRPHRAVADEGRRNEARNKLTEVRKHL